MSGSVKNEKVHRLSEKIILTIQTLTEMTGSHGVHPNPFKGRNKSAKIVPCLLTEEQKQRCVDICRYKQDETKNDPAIPEKVVTGNEVWCYLMTLNQSSSQANESHKIQWVCGENILKSGKVGIIGSCTMTIPLLTQMLAFNSF